MFLYMKLFICTLEIILIINVLTAQRKEETGRYVYIDDNGIRQYCHYCNRTGLGPYDRDRYVEQKCVEKNYPFENKTDEEEQRNQWQPLCTKGTIPSCPELKTDSNGEWNCSSEQNETEIYFSETEGTYILPVYTKCTLTCTNNFQVTYRNSTYCNESRQWDADQGSIHCVKVTDLKRNLEGSSFLIAPLVSTIGITMVIMIIICCGLVLRRRRKLYIRPSSSYSWIAKRFDEIYQTQTLRKLDGMDMPECMVKTITSTTMPEKDKTSFQEGGEANMVYKDIPYTGQIEKYTNCSQSVPDAIATENEGNNYIQERTCSQRMDKDTVVEQGIELENYSLNTPLWNEVSLEIGSAENATKEAKRTFANGTGDDSELMNADSDSGVYDKANGHTKIENEKKWRNDTPICQGIDGEIATSYKYLEKQDTEEKVYIEQGNDKIMEIKLPNKEEIPHIAENRERRVSSIQSAEDEMKTAIRLSTFDNNDYYGIGTVERTLSLAEGDDSISLENCKSIEDLQKLFGDKEHDPSDKLAPFHDAVEHLINCGNNISLQQFLEDVGREDEDKVLNCLKCSLSLHDYVEKQSKTKIILSWICNELTKFHNPHKVEVWPATLVGKDSDQLFPILICNYWDDVIETYRGKHFYGMIVKYQEYDSVNKEELFLRARNEFLESTLSKTQAKEANAIVSKNTDMLMENYRNLEMIKPCHVRSVHFQSENIKKKGKWEVIQEPTIVLYCRMKGYIPFGETLFPKRLGDGQRSLPVDVREGFFVGAMLKGISTFSEAGENLDTSTVSAEEEWDPSLFRMGVSMGPLEKLVQGTVGPFVNLDDNAIGFLTCAHVFGIPSTVSNVKGKAVVHPANGEYVSVHGTDNDDVCGHIDRIVFDVNPDHPVSVDAAIVKIKAGKTPHRGRFARMDARDLSEAGLQPGQSLKYDNGEILKKETIEKEQLKQGKFIKFGSKSGVTSSNRLGHEHIVVRVRQDAALDHDDRELSPPIIGGIREYLMKGQYVIDSKSRIPFLVPGDSGCGVFHMDEHRMLRCVGIGIGSMSFGQEAVVTPIEDILRALDLGEDALMKFFSTPPNILENTHL
ncbi:hypothetical protein CHS0354_004967 [Potamilus streckersoni]|uniref:DNA-directed RNA polymerase n=1 Tax=Potamilus streckersoni TaxID=2493646 RepID=A0AAE0SSB2_9BIVA|nr:hypothetical protein CHS0354_004967 [Potamilus streckersoni]